MLDLKHNSMLMRVVLAAELIKERFGAQESVGDCLVVFAEMLHEILR